MNTVKQLIEAARLAELQVEHLAKNSEEQRLYLCAVKLYQQAVKHGPLLEQGLGDYLRGVLHMVRMAEVGDDSTLYLASWNTLGLLDDGAEWPKRLEIARQELRGLGVKV